MYLWDVRRAGEAVGQFLEGLNAEAYADSLLVRSAVERQFEIIGEALGQLARQARTWRSVFRIPER